MSESDLLPAGFGRWVARPPTVPVVFPVDDRVGQSGVSAQADARQVPVAEGSPQAADSTNVMPSAVSTGGCLLVRDEPSGVWV